VARGLIAIGPVALGVVAVGPISIGLLALGQIAVGITFAGGQVAAGAGAFGQLALGSLLAAGQVAAARSAFGQLVWEGGWAQSGLALAWLIAAAALGAAWWRRGRVVARLLGVRQSIAHARPGAALLQGRVMPLATVEAPVSRRACVGYDLRRVQGRHAVDAEHACEDFVVDDGSGRARIVAGDALLLLEPARRVSEAIESRVVAHQAIGGGKEAGGVVRAVGSAIERVLLPGEVVRVAGHVLRSVAGEGRPQIAVHGGAAGPVLVTNRDLDEVRVEARLWLVFAVVLAASAVAAVAGVMVA
jgi:hypothetical protein